MNNNHQCPKWDGLFSEEEIGNLLEFFSKNPTKEAGVLKGVDTVTDKSVRVTNINFYQRSSNTNWIFDRLDWVIKEINKKYYRFDITSFDNFQYCEYYGSNGGKYDWHTDSSFGNTGDTTRKLSLSLLLNDDYEGGEFELNWAGNKVSINKGQLIIFPSVLMHRVKPVRKGTRKSLVVWMQGPNFK